MGRYKIGNILLNYRNGKELPVDLNKKNRYFYSMGAV